MAPNFDVAVVGGGLVGAAIARGLAAPGRRVAMLDEGDLALRAARGNFGLVWVQGKGVDFPAYARWTALSVQLWPAFAQALEAETGVAIGYQRPGGLHICLGSNEFEARTSVLERLREASGNRFQYQMLDREALAGRLPAIGPQVCGASYCPDDGHCNPLYLLRALHQSFRHRGGTYLPHHGVSRVERDGDGYSLTTCAGPLSADRVVLAAGLGNRTLAPPLGLEPHIRANRGQVLVTERVRPFLSLPTVHLRQTIEGSLLIGDSHEDVGDNDGTSGEVLSMIARRAVRAFPFLAEVRPVRAWGALRILTADGAPVYQQSATYPGVYVAACHSGVTLAAVHAERLPAWILGAELPDAAAFTTERFDVQALA